MKTNFVITIKTTNYPSWIQPSIANQLNDGEGITNFRISSNLTETEMYVTFDLNLEEIVDDAAAWVYETIAEQLESDEEIVIYNTHSIIA